MDERLTKILIFVLVLFIAPAVAFGFFAEPDLQVHSMPFGVKENYSGVSPALPPSGINGSSVGANSGNLANPGVDSPSETGLKSRQNNMNAKESFSFDAISFIMWSVISLIIIFAVFIFSLRGRDKK